MFQKKATRARRNQDRSGEILPPRRFSDAAIRGLPLTANMKHLLVGAFAGFSLLACGSEVVIEDEPSAGAGQGGSSSGNGAGNGNGNGNGGSNSSGGLGGGAAATTGSDTTTGPVATGCEMSCTNKGEPACSCVRTCIGGSLGEEFRKVVCKPIAGGVIECVCTLDSGTFSGVCYEKKQKACDFDDGCCANYFSGK
jgi:hypothetical protein